MNRRYTSILQNYESWKNKSIEDKTWFEAFSKSMYTFQDHALIFSPTIITGYLRSVVYNSSNNIAPIIFIKDIFQIIIRARCIHSEILSYYYRLSSEFDQTLSQSSQQSDNLLKEFSSFMLSIGALHSAAKSAFELFHIIPKELPIKIGKVFVESVKSDILIYDKD